MMSPLVSTRGPIPSPAPLVPALFSNAEETRIAVHHSRLVDIDENTALDIIRTSGQPYLRMSITSNNSGYSLNIINARDSQRVCSIESNLTDLKSPYKILNAQGGEHGVFRYVGATLPTYEVVVQGVSCYEIQGSSDTLRYQVADKLNHKARIVAMAQINRDDFPGGEHFEFRCLPGSDAVLITSVILGITVFHADG